MRYFISTILCLLQLATISFVIAFAEPSKIIQGNVEKTDTPVIIKGNIEKTATPEANYLKNLEIDAGIKKEDYKYKDIQVIRTSFYYYPDAEMFFDLLKQQGQRQYPHLLGYREIDGLYKKAVSQSSYKDILSIWRYNGGPKPYIILTGADIRNNGTGSLKDITVKFDYHIKVAPLKANSKSLTTSYNTLSKNAKWQYWFSTRTNISILPVGEYKRVYSDDVSLCSMLERLQGKFLESIKVTVTASAPKDGIKTNNAKTSIIKLYPDHYITKVLR